MFGAYLLFLSIEAPIAGMQKILFSKRKNSSEAPKTEIELGKQVIIVGDELDIVRESRKEGYENRIKIESDDEKNASLEKHFNDRF